MDPPALALEQKPLRQEWPLPSRPRPIVLIGAGGIVRAAHLPAYRRAGFVVAGLFDLRPQVAKALAAESRAKSATGVAAPVVYESVEQAISAAEACGAVFDVAVPAEAVHGVLEQLPQGAAVLIQKPFGRDFPEARRLLELCHTKELTAAVNFQLRFSPNVLALRDALDRGLLGRVTDVEVRINVHTPWHLWDFLRGIPRHEILYHSIHYLDLLRAMLGEPRGVYCKVTRNPELPDYSDTSSATVLDYGEHLRCVVSAQHDHDYGTEHAMSQLKVEGTRGAAVLKMGVNLDYPHGQPDVLEIASRDAKVWHPVPLRGGWFDHAFEGTMANLQRYVAGEDPVLSTRAEDAARTMALVEACYQSSAAGGTPLPEVPEATPGTFGRSGESP